MNFSTLQGLTIPEGVVTQIADASGNVLWSSTIKFTINGETYVADRGMTWAEWFASSYNTTGETEGTITDADGNEVSLDAVIVGGTAYEVGFGSGTAIVTLTADTFSTNYCSSCVSYETPDGEWGTLSTAGEYELPIGTIIRFSLEINDDSYHPNVTVEMNGESVASSDNYINYEHTLTTNIAVTPLNNAYAGGAISITEIPEGHALVKIVREGMEDKARATIDGTEYSDDSYKTTALAVPVGTEIYCVADGNYYGGWIKLNDVTVAGGSQVANGGDATYAYTVSGSVEIRLGYNSGGMYGTSGNIEIIEE